MARAAVWTGFGTVLGAVFSVSHCLGIEAYRSVLGDRAFPRDLDDVRWVVVAGGLIRRFPFLIPFRCG